MAIPVVQAKNFRVILDHFLSLTHFISNSSANPVPSKYSQNPPTFDYLCCYHPESSHHHHLTWILQEPPNWSLYFCPCFPQSNLNSVAGVNLLKCKSECVMSLLLCSQPSNGSYFTHNKRQGPYKGLWSSPTPNTLLWHTGLFTISRPLFLEHFRQTRTLGPLLSAWDALLQISAWLTLSPPPGLCSAVTFSVRLPLGHPTWNCKL